MQAAAAVCFMSPLPVRSPKKASLPTSSNPHSSLLKPRAVAVTSSETSTIDYSSSLSVFPMEACEILGGEACNARMFPEAKLAAAAGSGGRPASEEIDRDYLEYNDPKTVFPGEACDDLGGEFCQAEYQNGVF
ncbi:light-regulated protein, chloroplastic-like [Musa acuminata AAA Group]|uniref:light-regulated protein, chloroplastic-like n=1 Tax=Musa acuminata AAA Group TaxID=214697 RepID=UPI0031CE094A